MNPDLVKRHTSLTANVVAFCRYLRTNGFSLGPREEADALRVLELLPVLNNNESFRLALQSVLARSLKQQKQFGELYKDYWKELERAVNSKKKEKEDKEVKKLGDGQQAPSLKALKNWLHGNKEEELTETAGYSASSVLGQKDFSSFGKEELEEVIRVIHIMARQLANQYNRRYQRSHRGNFDLRRSLRLNMRRGGEIVDLAFRRPQRNRMKIVLLCDVSKSMELYSRFLLDKNTIVLIMSDGFDTGDIEVLEKQMKAIHKKASKVIWLNPMAGNPNYEPSVKGMEVAMPYIDVFAAAHNIDSLKSMAKFL